MKIGWRMAKTFSGTYEKLVLYHHISRYLWDVVWMEETQDGQVVAGGIKDGTYLRKETGYDFFQAHDYTPEPEDIHHAIQAVFGEL